MRGGGCLRNDSRETEGGRTHRYAIPHLNLSVNLNLNLPLCFPGRREGKGIVHVYAYVHVDRETLPVEYACAKVSAPFLREESSNDIRCDSTLR